MRGETCVVWPSIHALTAKPCWTHSATWVQRNLAGKGFPHQETPKGSNHLRAKTQASCVRGCCSQARQYCGAHNTSLLGCKTAWCLTNTEKMAVETNSATTILRESRRCHQQSPAHPEGECPNVTTRYGEKIHYSEWRAASSKRHRLICAKFLYNPGCELGACVSSSVQAPAPEAARSLE